MFKVFYSLPNDIVDKSTARVGLIDILNSGKCRVYTELNQIKGERIDLAYVMDDEKLLSQLGEQVVRKISVFTKGDDDIVIPKNFVKYSSEKMLSMSGNYYNVILNNKSYRTEVEILIIGEDNPYQDLLRNFYSLFGNVIMNTYGKYNLGDLRNQITTRSIPNSGNIYFNVTSVLDGINKCIMKKIIIKSKTNEHITDLQPMIAYLQSNNKIVTTNVEFRKTATRKFSMSDHIVAGKYETMLKMYSNAKEILKNKVCEMRKKLRLDYTPEQILTVGYLKDKMDFMASANDSDYVQTLMKQSFQVYPIEEVGNFFFPFGKQNLVSGKQMNRELYSVVCEIKTIEDV